MNERQRTQVLQLLKDMVANEEDLREEAKGVTKEQYAGDGRIRGSLLWMMKDVAEPVSRIGKIDERLANELDVGRELRRIRNVTIHEYEIVDVENEWEAVTVTTRKVVEKAKKVLERMQRC